MSEVLYGYIGIVLKRKKIFVLSSAVAFIALFVYFLFSYREPALFKATGLIRLIEGVKNIESGNVERFYGQDNPEKREKDLKARRLGMIDLINSAYFQEKLARELSNKIGSETLSTGETVSEYLMTQPQAFSKRIRITPQSEFLLVEAESPSTHLAYYTVLCLLDLMQSEIINTRKQIVQDAYDAFEQQLRTIRVELENAKTAFSRFVVENDILAEAVESQETFSDTENLAVQYLKVQGERNEKEEFLVSLNEIEKIEGVIEAYKFILREGAKSADEKLIDQWTAKKQEVDTLLLVNMPIHPDVIKQQEEQLRIEAQIRESLEKNKALLAREKRLLQEKENRLHLLIEKGLTNVMIEFNLLKNNIASKEKIYKDFLNTMQQIDVYEQLVEQGGFKVVAQPEMPVRAFNTTSAARMALMARYFLFSLLGGVLVGGGGAILAENLDVTVKNLKEIEELLGGVILSAIPAFGPRGKKQTTADEYIPLLVPEDGKKKETVQITEAFRGLRTNLKFACAEKKTKIVTITSSLPREGKTFIASNLAAFLARSGEKVLLIDADMRKPKVHRYFNIDNERGLSNLLDEQPLEPCATAMANLWVIPSGKMPVDPPQLLSSGEFSGMLKRFEPDFNWIIVDTPPLLSVTDSFIVANKTHGLILVVSLHTAPRKAVARTKSIIDTIETEQIGLIANNLEQKPGAYSYYYYSYYYEDDKKKS